eukprot:scaffold109946_cov37-Attheya_sp.AAC.2
MGRKLSSSNKDHNKAKLFYFVKAEALIALRSCRVTRRFRQIHRVALVSVGVKITSTASIAVLVAGA